MGANGQYVVQEERKEGACCSTWRRTACQDEGQVYQVSDELVLVELNIRQKKLFVI
jgi:hypothetical protein